MSTTGGAQVAVLGAGAVGCYFGGMLARAGIPVTLIGRPQHVEAINREGLFLDGLRIQERIAVAATTEISAAREASVVLVCVKTLHTEEAARQLVLNLKPDAAVVSLQNGVDNADRIRAATGIDAIACVVYVAASMSAPGRVKHSGRGDLILDRHAASEGIAELFTRAGVPCPISDNIGADLWTKLIMNCAYNAISALTRTRYGGIVRNPGTREVMRQVVEECITVAQAAGIRFGEADLVQAAFTLGEAMENALSSTAQDLARGNRTEIDSLNGYVARRGAELGVATPVNQTLHALVKLLEESPVI